MGTRPLLLAQPGLLTAELEELGFQDVSCETVEFPMEVNRQIQQPMPRTHGRKESPHVSD